MKRQLISLLLLIVLLLSFAITAIATMPIGETYDVELVKGESITILVPWDGESKELFSGSDPLYIDVSNPILSYIRLGPVATTETPSGRCLKYEIVGNRLGSTTMKFTNNKTGTTLATYNFTIVDSATPSESPKPSETVKPSESPKPSETVKPSESPKPSETVKPSESPKVNEVELVREDSITIQVLWDQEKYTINNGIDPMEIDVSNPRIISYMKHGPSSSSDGVILTYTIVGSHVGTTSMVFKNTNTGKTLASYSINVIDNVTPTESPKPSETVKPTESPKPSETVKPTESPKPSETVKPTESPKPSETVKPTESPKPSETVKPTQSPKPSETVKPTQSPKPSETVKPTQSPKPSETVKPTQSPKPSETVKPTQSPKPSETVKPSESPKPVDPTDNHSNNCPSKPFSDMKNTEGKWFHKGVDYAISKGYMAGVENNLFAPNRAVSRAMVAQILYAAEGKPGVTNSAGFTDIKTGRWYAEAVNWAAGRGFVAGYPDKTFKPDKSVTREELATILYKYSQTKKDHSDIIPGILSKYPDASQLHQYAITPMCWAVSNGIISGTDKGLEPRGTATRAQLAVILQAFDKT